MYMMDVFSSIFPGKYMRYLQYICVHVCVVCNVCVQVHAPVSPLRPEEVIEYPSVTLSHPFVSQSLLNLDPAFGVGWQSAVPSDLPILAHLRPGRY